MPEVHQFYDQQPEAKRLETWNIIELIDKQAPRIHAYADPETAVQEFIRLAEERGFPDAKIDLWRQNAISCLAGVGYYMRMQRSETEFKPVAEQ